MSNVDAIRVEGLREIARALRNLDRALPRELRKTNLDAARHVAGAAKVAATSLGGVAAEAAPSIRALATATSASVRLGDARHPYALGAEFGAHHDRARPTRRGVVRGWNQFPEWTGNGRTAGRFLFPTVRGELPEVVDLYAEMLADLADRLFG